MKKLAAVVAFMFPVIAFAQDVAVLPGSTAGGDPLAGVMEVVKLLGAAAKQGQWAMFAVLCVLGVTALLQLVGGKVAPPESGFGKFWASRWTKWGVNFVMSAAGTMYVSLKAGTPFGAAMVVAAVMVAFTAAGTLEFVRDVWGKFGAKKVEAAGAAAAANPGPTLNG